jgi:hypothetical protein
MSDQEPFANWPNLDKKPPRPEREHLILPGSAESQSDREHSSMASRNGLEDFLGGSPLSVAVRLFFISLVVGALLMWLDIRPIDIVRGVQAFFDRIYRLGFDAVREVASYVVAGAAIVIPAWFVLRLLNIGGRR